MLRKINFVSFFCIILSSVFLFLAFPKANLFYFAFFAFVPSLLDVSSSQNFKTAFMKSVIFSIVTNFALIYWIIPTFHATSISNFISVFTCLLFAIYLSIYWIIFFAVFYFFRKDSSFTNMCFLSSVWVLLEFAKTYVFTGFPWSLVGYTQSSNLYFIQIADITGIYGISFLIILANLYFFSLLKYFFYNLQSKQNNSIIIPDIKRKTLFVLLIFIFVFGYSFYILRFCNFDKFKKSEISFAILQGNIEQYKKFDNDYMRQIRDLYVDLANTCKATDIVVWPETAYPHLFPEYKDFFFENLRIKSRHIIGTFIEKNSNFYNSALFLNQDLTAKDFYSKVHLVPFGEFFPYKKYLEKLIPSLKRVGNVSPGEKFTLFEYKDTLLGTMICYESLFPDLARRFTKRGANILVNISNDAWYLDTCAPYQHFSFNIFRAIENRRVLIRTANTGISGIIDQFGKVLIKSDLNSRICLKVKTAGLKKLTFYTKFGNVFVLLAFLFVVGFFLKRSCYF